MSTRITCFMLWDTGRMTAFDDGLSSSIFRAADGREFHLGFGVHPEVVRAPAGAMWISKSGAGLVVRTPGGDWYVDGRARNGDGWTRTGEPPNITVVGSILQERPNELAGTRIYHGVLSGGVLQEC